MIAVALSFGANATLAKPRVVVVLADHLSLSDVSPTVAPHLAMLSGRALMSPGLAHGVDPIGNVYASLGAGDSVDVGDVSQGLLERTLRAGGMRVAALGDSDGDDTGVYRPMERFLDQPEGGANSGCVVSDPLAAGGERMDANKCLHLARELLADHDLVAISWGDLDRIEREEQRSLLTPSAYARHRLTAVSELDRFIGLLLGSVDRHGDAKPPDGTPGPLIVYVVTPVGPLSANGRWERLTPLFRGTSADANRQGAAIPLTSTTTRVPGLVASRDLAPSILRDLGARAPVVMTGAPIVPGPNGAGADLLRLDLATLLNQRIAAPFFWTLGFAGGLFAFAALAAYFAGWMGPGSRWRGVVLQGFRVLAGWPLALMVAPLARPTTELRYGLDIAIAMAAVSLIGRPATIAAVSAVALLIDGVTGSHLVAGSALSGYALSGIRFYGIGNEYMGVLLAGGLLACAVGETGRGRIERGRVIRFTTDNGSRTFLGRLDWLVARPGATFTWFAALILVLSFPAFGAKAGGAVTATATFLIAWRRLGGHRVSWKTAVVGIVAGFGLVFAWAGLSALLHIAPTHMDSAVRAVSGGRMGYIKGVSLRKASMGLRVLAHPGSVLGIAGLAGLWLASRRAFGVRLDSLLQTRPRLAAVLEAGAWGCAICVLFNDSGVVAAIVLFSLLILEVTHALFEASCDSSPWMSVPSELESPSATSVRQEPFPTEPSPAPEA